MKGLAELLVSLAAASWRAVRTLLVGVGALPRASSRQVRAWREAATAAGLASVDVSDDGLVGRAGSLQVRLAGYACGDVHGTRISISGLSPDVTLQPEGFGGSGRVSREVEIGDAAFDRAAWIEGPPALVRSLLDAETRRQIASLFEGRLERPRLAPFRVEGQVDEGVLRVDVPEVAPPLARRPGQALLSLAPTGPLDPAGSQVAGPHSLPDVLRLVVDLARRLETPRDLPGRLAATLAKEPVAGVRRRCLATLAREFPCRDATRGALLSARADPDAEVRLQAGTLLGREGRGVLLAIAGGEGADDETTARAVAELAGGLSADEATVLLRSALRTRRLATAAQCLSALGQRGGPQVIPTLARVLAVEKSDLAAAAAAALGATGDGAAEHALLAALDSPTPEVRAACARALGRCGTTASVQPLRELEHRDRPCRAIARQAIAEIQSRLSGAEPGQLSLAAGEPGQLSLADGEAGRLSLGGARQDDAEA